MSESNTPNPEFGPEAKFRPNLLMQWFVFPMLVVVLCVGLYLSFRFLMADSKTTQDYLNDLNSGNPHRVWQAAFSLANQVNLNRLAEDEKPQVAKRLLEMLDQSSPEAGQIRQYFILTLGRLHDSSAIPKLLDLAQGPDASERIYSLLALGEIKSMTALDAATKSLNDEDPAVRKTAAHVFALLKRPVPGLEDAPVWPPDIAARLYPLLNDPIADVRWNAALSLAEFRDTMAIAVLTEMLDREKLSDELKKSGGLDEINAEKIIKAALAASLRYRDPALVDRIEKLAASDPQAAIISAATQTLERLREAR